MAARTETRPRVEAHVLADDTRERYRIYRRLRGSEQRAGFRGQAGLGSPETPDPLVLISTTPTSRGIGVALVAHHEEGNITKDDRVGVLDAVEATWIVNPFANPEAV
jgi:hypothetical protein